jgi:hypothetical protein
MEGEFCRGEVLTCPICSLDEGDHLTQGGPHRRVLWRHAHGGNGCLQARVHSQALPMIGELEGQSRAQNADDQRYRK